MFFTLSARQAKSSVVIMRYKKMKKIFSPLFLIIIITTALSCSNSNKFKFNLPDVKNYKEIEVRYLKSDDNVKLAYRQIGPENSKTGLVFVPGSTMYGYYYVHLLSGFSKYNILVRIIDIRGHGDSEGKRGDVPSSNTLIEDLSQHIKDLKSKNHEMKIVIGGHSMGGGICGRYLEYSGYDSVKGVVYIAPFFHYMQPGMKNAGYVDVNILTVLFGKDHAVSQIYHPSSDDPKLVKEYTNIMSKASMVSDFTKFRKNHTTKTMFIIGKNDELFDIEKSMKIFDDKSIKYILLDETGHINYKPESFNGILKFINGI